MRLALCFDGTWNTPDADPGNGDAATNVWKMYAAIADGPQQRKYYHSGVGTHWYDRVVGGLTGFGLSRNMLDGYRWLAQNYQDGDEVFLFGFSRGAYTARSLAGLLHKCGLPTQAGWLRVAQAYELYVAQDNDAEADAFRRQYARAVPIRMVGVWDTVGELGVPVDAFRSWDRKIARFHDTDLTPSIENAFHAVAIDEHRASFAPTLWTNAQPNQRVEQRWFVGAHANVGGGYADSRLSDIALRWMQEMALECGLALTPVALDGGAYLGLIRDSYAEFLDGAYARMYPPFYRPYGQAPGGHESVDESARWRHEDAAYRPPNPNLAQVLEG